MCVTIPLQHAAHAVFFEVWVPYSRTVLKMWAELPMAELVYTCTQLTLPIKQKAHNQIRERCKHNGLGRVSLLRGSLVLQLHAWTMLSQLVSLCQHSV